MNKVTHQPAANPTAAQAPKEKRNPKPQKAQPCTINIYALPALRMHNMEPARVGASDHLTIGRVGMPC